MEERIIDRDRRIKLKRTEDGVDAVDETAEPVDPAEPAAEGEEEGEVYFDLPEGEYDDDLVGLTPSQLEEKRKERERAEAKAREEYEKLLADGERLVGIGKFAQAVPLFEQATYYGCDDGTAQRRLWFARTAGYTSGEVFFEEGVAEDFAALDESIRGEVLGKMEASLKEERRACREEAEPLRTSYSAKQEERAEAFEANKKYYRVRFWAVFALFAALVVACGVSGAYILRVQGNTPLILTIVFGALAFFVLVAVLFLARKLYVAHRYVRENADPASTEEGARLVALEHRIAALDLVLGEEENR